MTKILICLVLVVGLWGQTGSIPPSSGSGGAGHTQNTDTGTNATSFQVDSSSSGPRIKNESGVLAARNAADSGYVAVKASSYEVDSVLAGVSTWCEALANGTDCIALTVPDSITTGYTLKLPNALPSGGQVLSFPTPSSGVSQAVWVTPVTVGTTQINWPIQMPVGVRSPGGTTTVGPFWTGTATNTTSAGDAANQEAYLQVTDANAATGFFMGRIYLPTGWVAGTSMTISMRFFSSAISQAHTVSVDTSCITTALTAPSSWNAASAPQSFTTSATIGVISTVTVTGVSLANCSAAGDYLRIRITRDGADGSTNTLNFLGSEVVFVRTL